MTVRAHLKNHGLSLATFALFVASLIGQIFTGHAEYNSDAADHGSPHVALLEYLTGGHFVEAVFENWESEFLQIAIFVVFTIFLRQKGSSESKKIEGDDEVDEPAETRRDDPRAPWPVRTGRFLWLYANSLTIALVSLFLLSFVLHALGGVRHFNEEQAWHGKSPVGVADYVVSSRFWFESFQNWQSEFLSVYVLVVLSIYLRQRGSPQSKPVGARHSATGE